MQHGNLECRRSQPDMRIVGKAEALLGKAEDVSVELHVLVLIVQSHDPVVARGYWVNQNRCLPLALRNGRGLMADRLGHIFRPALGRAKKQDPHDSLRIPQPIDVDAQRTLRS